MKNRKDYWNREYTQYWKDRVVEANESDSTMSKIIDDDIKTTSTKVYENSISELDITNKDNVIEIGVGFGRSLPFLSNKAKSITAIDISDAMIKEVKMSAKFDNVEFYVMPCEETDFNNNTFDVCVCFAVFDATYQKEALIEINRICKKNARVLITGKNDNYRDDDILALNAEIGARAKNHPNYFTNVHKIIKIMDSFGFKIISSKYFSKRGDFAKNKYYSYPPDKFYEYQFILHKTSKIKIDELDTISSDYSKTYLRSKNI